MKVSSAKTTETKEIKDTRELTNDDIKKLDGECLSQCNMAFKDIINSTDLQNDMSLSSSVSKNDPVSLFDDLKSSFNYNTFTIDKDDAQFFSDMVNQTGKFSVSAQQGTSTSVIQLDSTTDVKTYKSANVSKTLINMVDEAYNTQKPVRIDFDNNIAVILKVDKDGKIKAQFIPGDKAVEAYLKENIASLRQSFDEQNLPYNELSYKQSRQQQQQNKQKNKGE